tara:strand:+ start:220 stop:600 length:381 start_codon:yes stop_codon:yes gene_type:complete
MSKKSRKVVDKSAINEVLNNKGKEMLGEAFEGINGVVPLGAIHNMEGSFSQQKQTVNETIPALGKEWSKLDKACDILYKAVYDLAKGVGRIDKKQQKEVEGLWKYTESNIKKFKELVSDEILSKLQ